MGGERRGAPVCKPDTLAVTVNKLTQRKTCAGGIKREEIREGRTQKEIKSDGEKERKEGEGSEGKKAKLLY